MLVRLPIRLHVAGEVRGKAEIKHFLNLRQSCPMHGIGIAQAPHAVMRAQCLDKRTCARVRTMEPGSKGGEELGGRELYAPLIRERGSELKRCDATPLEQCNGGRTVPTFENERLVLKMRHQGHESDATGGLHKDTSEIEDHDTLLRHGLVRLTFEFTARGGGRSPMQRA